MENVLIKKEYIRKSDIKRRNYNCLICDYKISNKTYAISRHLKKHNTTFSEYIEKYYKLISGEMSNCGFCNKEAIPIYEVNHDLKTYSINYENGYFCGTNECKNDISIELLGHEYESKKFEKIGSRSDYLSRLYKIPISEAKDLKYKESVVKFRCSLLEFKAKYGDTEGENRYNKRINGITKNTARNKFPCTLENFIKRYDAEIGTKKYNDRCERISYTSSKDFFINKYGEIKGEEIWKNKFKRVRISKKSKIVKNILDNLKINYESEKGILNKFVDFYLPEYNIAIEYFGDYWHGNPKKFESSRYIVQLKMTAGELWEKDRIRLDLIKQKVDSIIIIWESSEIDTTILEKTINEIKNKKTIIYI